MTVGETDGLDKVDVNPLGFETHEYVLPLTAAAPIDVLCPVQIVLLLATDAFGNGFTVTVTAFDLKQPVAVIVSVSV